MSTKSWRKSSPVISQLKDYPEEFQFTQAVRLIERVCALNKTENGNEPTHPVARFVPPATEAVRFHSNNSLSFPSSEIQDATVNNQNQWDMTVNFMGLTGAMGVMPYHYTEMILERHKQKDKSLSRFFDLFNHRIISLFFQASSKHKLPVEYERKKLNPPTILERDTQTQLLLSLIGLGTQHLTNRLYTNDESLLYYGGLLTQKIRTSTNLKQILQDHFNVPVEVKEFIGQWQELIDDVRTKLPSKDTPKGRNNHLGKSVMLGSKGWFAQGKIQIVIGPLNKENMINFAPGTKSLKALNEIVRFYTGMEYDYEFIIRINKCDVPDKISLNKETPSIMGWDTWLSKKHSAESTNDTFDITVSSGRIN